MNPHELWGFIPSGIGGHAGSGKCSDRDRLIEAAKEMRLQERGGQSRRSPVAVHQRVNPRRRDSPLADLARFGASGRCCGRIGRFSVWESHEAGLVAW